MATRHVLEVLGHYGFADGRMISHSKTGYCRRNRGHFVVFNTQVFTPRERIFKQVNLDLTLDGEKLTEAARAIRQNFDIWFSHGAAIPAILYERTLRLMERLSFTVHRGNSAIHIRRDSKVVGLCWSVGILAPEVIHNARAELKRLSSRATARHPQV